MSMRISFLAWAALSLPYFAFSQSDRWQQHVKYNMDINMDVTTNRMTGKQTLAYTNNSPDTLRKVFYHLYWNAFQPGSMMDVHSRELGKISYPTEGGHREQDWDPRVKDRIQHLSPDEIGYQKVISLTMNGVAQPFQAEETILQVDLTKPILPHTTVSFDMQFEAQVPLQIRRSGRDNPKTGVRYSMSQWYPKMCEYDYAGWHPTPYVAREFYGVWGDYDVKITIDKTYILGGTGYLENAAQIGYGYEGPGVKVARPAGDKLQWHFTAPNVHDFMWAADPGYHHLVRHIPNGPVINVLYKNKDNDPKQDTLWMTLADAAVIVLPYIEKTFGPYPYKQYSFIHGGDGGMEYPMGTLLAGPGLGGAFHEWMHSWYQGMLGTNESMYAWMDEGFTTYAEGRVSAYYYEQMLARHPDNAGYRDIVNQRRTQLPLIQPKAYEGYFNLARAGMTEPLTTHADHFHTNMTYETSSYSQGCIFLEQLGYIVGDSVRDKILLEYYREWRFKHPNANDFMRVSEKVSGMQLDWYKEYWINTTKTIDYAIDSLWEENGKSTERAGGPLSVTEGPKVTTEEERGKAAPTKAQTLDLSGKRATLPGAPVFRTFIRLRMDGDMPMPIDVLLTFKDGSKLMAYIPQYFMFGAKPVEDHTIPRTQFAPWKWTNPTYTFSFDRRLLDLKVVEIDPTQRMADTDRRNNKLELKW